MSSHLLSFTHCTMLTVTALGLGGCVFGSDAPGRGEKARAGFEQASSILVALEAYRAETDAYPDSLGQLVPRHVSADRLILSAPESGNLPFEYETLPSGYRLSFRYVGPGMNVCVFERIASTWDCHGYF